MNRISTSAITNSVTVEKNDGTFFFSNIRATIVLLVIFLHSALAYSTVSDRWWILADPQKTVMADIIAGALDIMLMSILFFIAGYFTLPSYTKCSSYQFLIKKLKNLMLPWLMSVLLLNPFLVNVIHYCNGNSNRSFLANTIVYYRNFLRVPLKIIQDRSESPFFFSHYHVWFLLLLFFFFIGFIVFRMISTRIKLRNMEAHSTGRFTTDVIALITLSSLGYFMFHAFFEDKWFVVSVVQFQVSRIVPYLVFFIFGIRSYEKGWLNKISCFRFPIISLFSATGFTLMYLTFYAYVNSSKSIVLCLMFSFLRYLLCTWYLLVFLRIGQKYFCRKTKFNIILTRNSFNVYIIHLNVTILFTLIFKGEAWLAPELKMILVFTFTAFSSYLITLFYDKIRNVKYLKKA